MVEPKADTTGDLKRVAILANVLTGFIAACAIIFCLVLYKQNNDLKAGRDCVRRIDLYVQDLRDDVNLTGWDTLVARAEGDTNQDVRAIAAEMRKNISTIKDTRQMRHDAISICDANPDFKLE